MARKRPSRRKTPKKEEMAFVRLPSKELCAAIVDCIRAMYEEKRRARAEQESRESWCVTVVIDGKAVAGKSELADNLRKRLTKRKAGGPDPVPVCIIRGDWYLIRRKERQQMREKGYRHVAGHKYVPASLHLSYWNWERLKQHVQRAQNLASEGGGQFEASGLYHRPTGECDHSEPLKVEQGSVIIVEGCYLLAQEFEWDIGILLYVNREIGRMRKIQREEKKEKGEFPEGERVGEVLPTWEELEEPTFHQHLIEYGRKADVAVDTSDTESMAVVKFWLPGYQRDDFRNAVKWDERVIEAETSKDIAKLLRLAKDAPTDEDAGRVLLDAGRLLQGELWFKEAEEVFGKALEKLPNSLNAMTQKALMLERQNQTDDAKKLLRKALRRLKKRGGAVEPAQKAEVSGIRGRVCKQLWTASWRSPGRSVAESKREASRKKNRRLLVDALRIYEARFRQDPTSYYNGDNAAALYALYEHLFPNGPLLEPSDPELGSKYEDLRPATRIAAQNALKEDLEDFWARTTLGNLAVMEGDRAEADRQYKFALGKPGAAESTDDTSRPDKFRLDSVARQLKLFADLGYNERMCRMFASMFQEEILAAPRRQGKKASIQKILRSWRNAG